MQGVENLDCRVLHLISSSGFLGAEHVLLELAVHSKLAGLKVTIGVFENSQHPNLELANIAKSLGFEIQIFPCNGRFDKKTIGMIRDYVGKTGIQILHSHNYKSNFYARAALSNNNVRWVVTNHGRRLGVKLLFYNLLDTFIARRADKLIAVSDEIARRMKLAGIDPKKIQIIENGVNLNRFIKNIASDSIKESLGIKKETLVIGTVGSLTKEKGHIYLLKAVPKVIASFPEVLFLFVGDGRERNKLERIASNLGIEDKVIFVGMRKDIPEILSILDVFVLPSLNEGLPIALLEAQAARIPTIATRVGAIPHVIEEGVTGKMVSPKDPETLSKALVQILGDRNSAFAMAGRGFERVKSHFSSQKMANQYLSLYQKLMEYTD